MELEQGKLITNLFTIEKITVNQHVVEIDLFDGTTKIQGLLKDNIDLFSKTYSVGDKIICRGRVRKRRKNFCLDLIYISKNIIEPEVIEKKFSVENYITRFESIISNITDSDYRLILNNCFNDDVKELYFTYPAARGNHHNYTHGLLEHSIEVVDISLLLADYFGNVNKDLLACAGLLHDIGKLKSYDTDEKTNYVKTDWELLLGHLSISALFVSKITPPNIDQQKIMLLYHLILSHHGELDFGSPIVCKTKEAYILNKADLLSSEINHIDSLKYTGNWSEVDSLFNRSWFRSV